MRYPKVSATLWRALSTVDDALKHNKRRLQSSVVDGTLARVRGELLDAARLAEALEEKRP